MKQQKDFYGFATEAGTRSTEMQQGTYEITKLLAMIGSELHAIRLSLEKIADQKQS